jgi:Fe-S-cluster containining protein
MMLSVADIERLETLESDRQKFVRYDRYGFARMRNRHGFCVFYCAEKCRCKIYRNRPLGCRLYPVIYSEHDGIILDDICPTRKSVSKEELEGKGNKVMELLQRIENEAACRRNSVKETLSAPINGKKD